MTFTIRLFSNPDNIGGTGVTRTPSLSVQSAYFDALDGVTLTTPNFVLGQPIYLNSPQETIMQYPYGYVLKNGKRWYFTVVSVNMVTANSCSIDYVIDAYETAQHQFNLTFKRTRVYRLGYAPSDNQTLYSVQQPYDGRADVPVSSVGSPNLCTFFVVRVNDKVIHGILIPSALTSEQRNLYVSRLTTGKWISEYLGFQESDVWNAGVAWADLEDSDMGDWYTGTAKDGITPYFDNATTGETDNPKGVLSKTYESPIQLWNHVNEWVELEDMRGNRVYKSPPYDSAFITAVSVDYTASSITLKYRLGFSATTDNFVVTVPAEPLDIFIDSYKEYMYRQRDADVRMRQLNIESGMAGGVANLGSNLLSGAIAGSLVPGIGTVAGLGLGAITTALDVATNAGINSVYGDKTQRATEDMYRKANDILSQIGNVGGALMDSDTPHHIMKVRWDESSAQQYMDDITTYGYYVDWTSPDYEENGLWPNGPITMDSEVCGDMPSTWKQQIRERFANGVNVIKKDSL